MYITTRKLNSDGQQFHQYQSCKASNKYDNGQIRDLFNRYF